MTEVVTTVDVNAKIVEAQRRVQESLSQQINIYNQLTQAAENAKVEVIRLQGALAAYDELLPLDDEHEHTDAEELDAEDERELLDWS